MVTRCFLSLCSVTFLAEDSQVNNTKTQNFASLKGSMVSGDLEIMKIAIASWGRAHELVNVNKLCHDQTQNSQRVTFVTITFLYSCRYAMDNFWTPTHRKIKNQSSASGSANKIAIIVPLDDPILLSKKL